VTLRVENDGEIPESERDQIFEPFRRGRGQQDGQRRDGLGLGLYIIQQIVIAHGGTIDVESRNGRTAFVVRLPRRAATTELREGDRSAGQTTFGAL
jgi:signal transduction histidine kinase